MVAHMRVLIFGDQTFDIRSQVKDLIQQRTNPLLDHFLVTVYNAIRNEIYKLPSEAKENLPRFTSPEDLLLREQNGERAIALDMASTCMYQLGSLISQNTLEQYSANDTCILGLCTGAITAAAVSCSRNTLELIPNAVHAVVVAFRTGMHVSAVANLVDSSSAPDSIWSTVLPGLASKQLMSSFREQSDLPSTSQPYISSYATSSITVSGPPSVLAEFRSYTAAKGITSKDIPIYGPYHASHLHSLLDVEDIVSCITEPLGSRASHLPVIPTADGKKQDGNFKALLKAALSQILLEPIVWDVIIERLVETLQHVQPNDCSLISVGTRAEQLICAALKQTSWCLVLNPAPVVPAVTESADYVSRSSPTKPKLAIVGMSGRFPGAQDNEAFWNVLHQGMDVHRPVPDLHWSARTHVDSTGTRKNTSATPFGCWLDDPAGFDARFFNISPREAPQMDPAQRLALMSAYEAIEQAGMVPDATPSTRRDRVGVFYGVTSNDWMETNSAQNIDTYFIPGGNRAFIPGRINYYFGFSGPSYAVDTACSSSLASIHIACNALWCKDIDTAIAGGTNILTNPDFTAGLDRGHFLSRTGNCKTFDDSADGYCRGEGVGTVIIKRLDDALADNDPILGVILGAYTNHSAESTSITRPHAGAQSAVFRKILNQTAVEPYSISYVEMHGTGTQAGDAGEMSSVLDTFAPSPNTVMRLRGDDEALYLGSAKSNIGHGEAASGVSSLIKVLLMMQKNTIVPHCGIKTRINRKFPTDLAKRKVNIALKPTKWSRGVNPRRAFVNNFSAAGGNTALLIEDAPIRKTLLDQSTDPRSNHLIAVSGKVGVSLQENLRSLLDFVKQNPAVSLGKLSYTTTARRIHHPHRVMLNVSNTDDLSNQIATALRDQTGVTRSKSVPGFVFTFTGQGAQYPGMGKDLINAFSLFRNEMRRLDQVAQHMGFPSFMPVILSDEKSDANDFEPAAVQLASVCLQISLSKLLASWNIKPTAVVGHSLGEYAALATAGVLSVADTIYLVGKRAALIHQKCTRDTHSMLVVKAAVEKIAGILKDRAFETACINSPVETVLAGPNEDIADFGHLLNDAGIRTTLLRVPYAFHSSQMEPVLEEFTRIAKAIPRNHPRIPVICPLDGSIVSDRTVFDENYFSRHLRAPVNMLKALLSAKERKFVSDRTMTIEIGPHPAISGMVKAVMEDQVSTLACMHRGRSSLQVLGTTLRHLYTTGADIRWAQYHIDYTNSHEVIPLPAYRWDLKPYWMQYVNDWSLRKGDPPLVITKDVPKLESTTIHRIVEESGGLEPTRVVVEADITRDDLSPLVQGHEVDGIPLCTPSVYADTALSLGAYLVDRYRPDLKDRVIDVTDMVISKALILRTGVTEQLLRTDVEIDWSSNEANMKFMSFDKQQKLQQHAQCIVRFKDRSLLQTLQQDIPRLKQDIRRLQDGIIAGTTARYNKPMVYRAIRPLARFHDDYRAIDEIILNSGTLEATSLLRFDSVKRDGVFNTHPAIIDSLTQSCGFTMNCNDNSDLDIEVFMNHGWGAFQIFEPLSFDKTYRTYTRMSPGKDKLWYGDVVVLDGDEPVAFFGQIAIQGVPRRVLKVILSIESGNTSSKSQPNPKTLLPPTKTSPDLVRTVEVSAPTPHQPTVSSMLTIIAEEAGIAQDQLTDDTDLADVGIDSLLGLTICARLKEELSLNIDDLYECNSVADLKVLARDLVADSPGCKTDDSDGVNSPTPPLSSRASTPATCDENLPDHARYDFNQVLRIVSEESGLAVGEVTDDTKFADCGVDSLLSMVIVSRLRDELGFEISEEFLFQECPTVADLRERLPGSPADTADTTVAAIPTVKSAPQPVHRMELTYGIETEDTVLKTRQRAVDALVKNYTADYTSPIPSPSGLDAGPNDNVIVVTGASGSLGSNLVYHLAQLPNVKTVVCLNRNNKTEPLARQLKAMREKGIRFPEALKPKLLVFQADSAKPKLGLSDAEYENLVGTATHLIHNAWPMSAKRELSGFESQFQVMRNLIDFGTEVTTRRPNGFRFSFQMISSIGVVGRYGLGNEETRTVVPEERMTIDALLPNGYGEAKWGCERMLDETLHRHENHFRTMVVRLGQIAGSSKSGYWNPMEHFGFLIKSSQTLKALPDVGGRVHWTPVDEIAPALSELLLMDRQPYPIYHIENPVGQSWKETNSILADALGIKDLIPFDEWMERVAAAPQRNNPAINLLEFLDSTYLRLSCGGLVLGTKHSLEHSQALRNVGPVTEEVIRKYIHIWKEIGFLSP